MTSTQSQIVEIDPTGDLTINVVEYDQDITFGNGEHHVLQKGSFKVSRQALLDAGGNDYWKGLLKGNFQEASSDEITLHEDTIVGMELWFRVFHGKLVEQSYKIPIVEIWHAIQASVKYLFHLEKLEEWFQGYWQQVVKKDFELHHLRQLLYPCYTFCHASAFAYVTKRLVHEAVWPISEYNPTEYSGLHLPARVIQQLRAAKSSMRNRITAAILNPVEWFAEHECGGVEKASRAYNKAACRTGIFPLNENTRSNKGIIESTGVINWKCAVTVGACFECRQMLNNKHILKLQKDIMNYWHGLCLKCMDTSGRDVDTEYWQLEDGGLSQSCHGIGGIQHGRNTWYFSFMGRPEIMETREREQRERKAQADRAKQKP